MAHLEPSERSQILEADGAAGLEGPHLGDVVSQVVDLQLGDRVRESLRKCFYTHRQTP